MTHASQKICHEICGYSYFPWLLYVIPQHHFSSLPLFSLALITSLHLLSSVFSSPTFWLMSLKYLPVPPPFFSVPLLSFLQFYFSPTNPHLSFAFFSHLHTHPPTTNSPPGLIISLQLLRGDLEQIRRENQAVFNRALALTRKLGFPDVILPGEKANT